MKFSKKILFSMFLVLISFVSCFGLSACSFGNSEKLTNKSGFEVIGGGFEKGSVLEANEIDSESKDYASTISLIAGETYDKDEPVYVFEISVTKDGVKVQPNKKVKVTVPVDVNLTGYDVLHIKDDGKIERLSASYKNGKVTFETDSFSKFVFIKKITPADSGDGSGDIDSGDDDSTTKYTISFDSDRIASTSYGTGGSILNTNDEYIDDTTLDLAEGTEFTVVSKPANEKYSFLGWYEATGREDATEENFLSNDPIYTFTVTKNLNLLALYAYKDDIVEMSLGGTSCGFSYRNGEPTTTIVSLSEGADQPSYEYVPVYVVLGNGMSDTWYMSATEFGSNIDFDLGGLDYSKTGTYTLTYTYKYNSNIKATLPVQVVDSANTLTVTGDSNLYFYCNEDYDNSCAKVFATGRLVTLSAMPKTGYAFTGWYDENNDLVSDKRVYCFEMPNNNVTLHGKYESSSISLKVLIDDYSWNKGELIDDFGNSYGWIGNTLYVKNGEKISFTVREKGLYEFLGWYDTTDGNSTLLTTNKTISLTITESKSIKTMFREKVKSIEIDSTTLSNEGFVDGKVGFAIGDAEIDYKNFTVKAKGVAGHDLTLTASDYTIDDSTVNFDVAGTYTITYTYKFNTAIKTKIQIVVINPTNAEFTFVEKLPYSYLDHEYNGKATFISLQDVKVNGIALYNFKSTSKIWEKISYKWIDKETNEAVDTTDVDITINGTIVTNFGGKNDKITIGNEFCGPIKAGSFRFELSYDGKTVLTKDSNISTQTYKKITNADELKSNEGSTWVNFELYYYTIIAQADNGKYYIMQMPSIGSGTEAEAREISVDANGNAIVGEDNDFAFAYMRYFASDKNSSEFLTGYYGSYISRSSADTVDGTLFGSPYIYRTGYTNISDGEICRDYGDKTNYGLSISFDENGAVTIHSKSGSDDGRLRLVNDDDCKYVFTSESEKSDSRQSFKVFIYRTIIDTSSPNYNK